MKKSGELIRVKSIIENDNLNISDNFYEIFEVDLCNILKEYFDFSEKPKIIIKKIGGNIQVKIMLEAICAKQFGYIPKPNNDWFY